MFLELAYTNWKPGQPDNKARIQHAVAIDTATGKADTSGLW
jgi:hypothetical protein